MDFFFQTIQTYFQTLDYLGLIALVLGLIYVILAAKGYRSCWIAGIISCSIIAWQDTSIYNLYADAVLQIFYVFVGIVGWFKWHKNPEDQLQDSYELKSVRHLQLIIGGIIISIGIWQLLYYYSDAAMPFLDSITSIFAVIATIMLLYKIPSNWIYWIVIDICYIYIYQRQGADFFAYLSAIYLVLAIYGFIKWRKI